MDKCATGVAQSYGPLVESNQRSSKWLQRELVFCSCIAAAAADPCRADAAREGTKNASASLLPCASSFDAPSKPGYGDVISSWAWIDGRRAKD